jgi:hypothetical protein
MTVTDGGRPARDLWTRPALATRTGGRTLLSRGRRPATQPGGLPGWFAGPILVRRPWDLPEPERTAR